VGAAGTAREHLVAVWGRRPWAHRLPPLAYLALLAGLAMPWVEGTPLVDGFRGSEPTGPVVIHGYEAANHVLPGIALAGLASAALLRDRTLRGGLSVAAFGVVGGLADLVAPPGRGPELRALLGRARARRRVRDGRGRPGGRPAGGRRRGPRGGAGLALPRLAG
jgi:hypothetical protein